MSEARLRALAIDSLDTCPSALRLPLSSCDCGEHAPFVPPQGEVPSDRCLHDACPYGQERQSGACAAAAAEGGTGEAPECHAASGLGPPYQVFCGVLGLNASEPVPGGFGPMGCHLLSSNEQLHVKALSAEVSRDGATCCRVPGGTEPAALGLRASPAQDCCATWAESAVPPAAPHANLGSPASGQRGQAAAGVEAPASAAAASESPAGHGACDERVGTPTMGVGAEPPPPPLPLALPAAPLPPAPELPAALAMLADVDSLSLGESGSRDTGVLCIGTRRGQQVAIKLRALPPSCTGGDGSGGSAAGGGLGGGGSGAQPGPTADPPQLTLEAAALLQHPHLVEVYDVRQAAMDERTMDELFPPPGLRPGWPLHRSQRPSGRLQKFLAAHGMDVPPPPPAGTSLRCSGAASASLTIRPGDILSPPPPRTPAHRALQALKGLALGGSVVAVFMEHCEAGNLGVAACARPSPFLASPSWSLRVAQRSLLRTAREMASGLRALHAAGLAHGSLRPSNVLLAAGRADRRGLARLADAGSTGLAASAANPLSLRPPALVMVAPEALIGSGVLHSPAADVYAFGMLLYLMAAGEMPFQGQHLDEVYNEISDLEAVVKAKPKRGGTAATAVSAGQGSATGVSAAALQADP